VDSRIEELFLTTPESRIPNGTQIETKVKKQRNQDEKSQHAAKEELALRELRLR